MNKSTALFTIPLFALLIAGAGCPTPPPGQPPGGQTVAPAAKLGFGKLPTIAGVSGDTSMKSSAESAAPPGAIPMQAPMADGYEGDAGVSTPSRGVAMPIEPGTVTIGDTVRPIPIPSPNPVTVEYKIETELPSWGAEGDVLKAVSSVPDASGAKTLVERDGIPGEITSRMSELTMLSLQWKDNENLLWNYSTPEKFLNFWQENYDQAQPAEKPEINEGAIIAAANAFLRSHGFASLADREATIQEMPWILETLKAQDAGAYPCPMMEGGSGVSGSGVADSNLKMMAPDSVTGESMMYPSPCFWWPMTVTVNYPSLLDGKKLAYLYGGELPAASVQVNLYTNKVTGGNFNLDHAVERSSYPLIDRETAMRRLQSGGIQPVWPWGSERGNISVHLTSVELVMVRYDVWEEGKNSIYYLPALLAKGTVDRDVPDYPELETEQYQTVVPLVSDDAFEAAMPIGDTYPKPLPMDIEVTPAEPPVMRESY